MERLDFYSAERVRRRPQQRNAGVHRGSQHSGRENQSHLDGEDASSSRWHHRRREGVEENIANRQAAEARTNFKGINQAEMSFKAGKSRYSNKSTEIGFIPEPGTRYQYMLAARGTKLARPTSALNAVEAVIIPTDILRFPKAESPAGLKEAGCPLTFGTNADDEPIGLGVTGAAPNDEYIAYALANLDGDADFGCWSIASFERKTTTGVVVKVGEPLHEQSDWQQK